MVCIVLRHASTESANGGWSTRTACLGLNSSFNYELFNSLINQFSKQLPQTLEEIKKLGNYSSNSSM